jgi:valacyclovir hydrolase
VISGSRTMATSVISEDSLQPLDNGLSINYCTSGSGDHPVLLLPGALGTGRTDFTPQLEGTDAIRRDLTLLDAI